MSDRRDSDSSAKRSRPWATAIAVAAMLLGGETASWAGGASEPLAAPAGQTEHVAAASKEAATAPRPPSMDQRYAARETNSKKLETFKGGDVVIIGASGLVVVLLVVLIIVII
jgi:hypothetical protein